jgi:hypothetical protein
MARSADNLSPAGISWERAMNNAAEILQEMSRHKINVTMWPSQSAAAQAWIAYAREITMHARGTQ